MPGDLQTRLRNLFRERSVRQLAKAAPLSLLATNCATALSAMLTIPGFAERPEGLIIGGIAINLTSSLLQHLVTLPLDEEDQRIAIIEQGLVANDAAIQALTAATLLAAGPDMAHALPAETSADLITGMAQGMQQAGGTLASMAPEYAQALRSPEQADWQALRQYVQQQIQIRARVEAGERAIIRESGIAIRGAQGHIDAEVLAGADSEITGSGIQISTGGPAPRPVTSSLAPQGSGVAITTQAQSGAHIQDVQTTYIANAEYLNIQLPDHVKRQQQADLLAYLRRTQNDCNALPLGKVDQTDAAYARPIELAHVYIALNTTAMVQDERQDTRQRPDQQRPLSVLEALSKARDGRMILLGAPGSGKSTVASHLSYCLAGAALQLAQHQSAAAWMQLLAGWRYGSLLPIPIILRDLAAMPEVATAKRGSVKLLVDYLSARLAELACPQALEPLLTALGDGKALLIFDGLDEVVGDAVLTHIAEAIIEATKSYAGPILVTCRVLDYQEETLRQLPGFETLTLADLDDEQVNQFIASWYRELANSGRRSPAQSASDTGQMQGAVQSRTELRALASTPLLLTLMAQVHAFRGTLPDARALLYEACIDLLLLRWRQTRDEPDLIERLGLSRFRSSDLLALMARLGYEAHTRAERDASSQGPADLDEATLMAILAEVFEAYDRQRCYELAELVLRALASGNGLLLQRGPKRYTFAHRTFQEFLAGYHLKGLRNAQKLCLDYAQQIHWHEALLLMVGYQVLGENELDKPISLAEKLIAFDGTGRALGSPLEQALAADTLALIGRERAGKFDSGLIAKDGLWARAMRSFRLVQSTGTAPEAPSSLRHRVGLALGRLCYGELKDLALPTARPPVADPRLPFAVVGMVQGEGWQKALERYWCAIQPGPFWFGDDRSEQLQRAEVRQPYQIARYPVTNAEYARFLAANGPDGYNPDKPWWTDHGRRYLLPGGTRSYSDEQAQITHPRFWTVARFNSPLQPVVGISWYEAVAYCRWLTALGQEQRWLPTEQVIRLPTWHEWERAARHTDQRRHPWGDEAPTPERANYAETGLNAPSPIGCFPAGAALCGAQDLLGNVMEWTASPYQQIHAWKKDFTNAEGVVLNWNDFTDEKERLCCGARIGGDPNYWNGDLGFRVLQSLAPVDEG